MGVHHPILQQAIIAAASTHMSNLLKAPVYGRSDHASASVDWNDSTEASHRALMHSFQARQGSLRLLHTAIQNLQSCERMVLLATILLLINIELIESGSHSWKPHLEGAIQLFLHTPPVGRDEETLEKFVISDLMMLVIDSPFPCIVLIIYGQLFCVCTVFGERSPIQPPSNACPEQVNSIAKRLHEQLHVLSC